MIARRRASSTVGFGLSRSEVRTLNVTGRCPIADFMREKQCVYY
jgi:hypothetical protein